MTKQLQLSIRPRLVYTAENFLPHAGLLPVIDAVRQHCTGSARLSPLLYVEGLARSGKTHLAIYLAAQSSLAAQDPLAGQAAMLCCYPRILEGTRFSEWLADPTHVASLREDDMLIVDNADQYLACLRPGDSGALVHCIEQARVSGALLVFLSALSIDEFQLDGHATSRLSAGAGLKLAPPTEQDIPQLINLMARQRGIALSEKKLGYIARRVGREVATIELYLNKLEQLSRILGSSVDLELLKDAI
jgi:chromosomal replication initiation ATPase DnaA